MKEEEKSCFGVNLVIDFHQMVDVWPLTVAKYTARTNIVRGGTAVLWLNIFIVLRSYLPNIFLVIFFALCVSGEPSGWK